MLIASGVVRNAKEQKAEGIKRSGAALRLVVLKNSATGTSDNAGRRPFWHSCHVQRNTVRELLRSKTMHK
jgi:hypothetical protein